MLFLYDDIAELNWQPLTDSSGAIGKFEFHVRGDKGAEKLFFHTGKLLERERLKRVALIILFVWTIFQLSVELNCMHTGLELILLALGIRV